MDQLIEHALKLASQPAIPLYSPIKNRIAYVVSHGQSYASNGYAIRTQGIAKALNEHGFDTLCFVRPGRPWELGATAQLESTIDGVRYIHSRWNTVAPASEKAHLEQSVQRFIELFRIYRPEVVVAGDNFTSALPALIAAKTLSLPAMKEHLSYGDAFLDEESLSYFLHMDFSEKFALEQACANMAGSAYHLYPNKAESLNAFINAIEKICQKKINSAPLAKLPPKGIYTVKYSSNNGGLYYLELDIDDSTSGNSRGAVASFRFFNKKGKLSKEKLPAFSSSKTYPQYQYINTLKADGTARVVLFSIPDDIVKVEVDVVAFNTTGELTIIKAKVGKVKVENVATWLTSAVPGVHWIKAVENYVHQEGATSLRLALLHYKHRLSQHRNDLSQLNGAIQEMVELDRSWIPQIAYSGKTISLKETTKLTIAHLHKTAYPYENTGGAIRCLNTALSQQRIGIDPYIITPIGYPRSAGVNGAKEKEVIEGIEHFRIGANTDGLRGISLPDRTSYSVFHIAKILKSRGADVIHAASGVRGYELALQALALKKITGLPLLYEVRSFHEHTWSPVRDDVMELEKTQLRVIKENFCMAEADFVTTISYSMKKILIERGVKPERIEVIPNAIDESKYLGKSFEAAEIPSLKGADFVVGYISNMSRREGHQYLIRAIHQLRKLTGLNVKGLLVGNGPERENLEKLTEELGMKEIIHFTGEVDHSKINNYYKAIDLFVIPRIPDYAADWVTPLKPYEAMALELPLIVTDLPALKEIVGDNEERGLVAKPADVDSLVEQLRRYINDPAMKEEKIKTAKNWVFSERTWSANAKRYENIYRRLITQNMGKKQEKQYA